MTHPVTGSTGANEFAAISIERRSRRPGQARGGRGGYQSSHHRALDRLERLSPQNLFHSYSYVLIPKLDKASKMGRFCDDSDRIGYASDRTGTRMGA